MNKLPLPNLPACPPEASSYERRLNVALNDWLAKVRVELNKNFGWRDNVASVSSARVPPASAPTATAFGPSGNRLEFAFAVNDYIFIKPFHINHDIEVGGAAYLHVHWTTNGTSTATVKWNFEILRAKGHNQEAFGAPINITVEQAASGTAWQHMIAEVSDANLLTLTEPDELILVTLKRITNGGVNNANTVFALEVDIHYESNRSATPQKAPNFYV